MSDESQLIQFQDALLELLSSGLPLEYVLETLRADSRFDTYRDYVNEFDPDMVAVACELMGQWSLRKEDH